MPFFSSISEHPVPATAVGEVAGQLLEQGAEGADLVCIFVTAPHTGALEDIAAAMHTLLDPKVMIGCAAEGVVGPGREVQGRPAVVGWAGNVGPVHGVRLDVVDQPTGGKAIAGWPINLGWVPAAAVLVADPFSFPINGLFDVLNGAGGFPRVVGGMASAGILPGGNRLVLNDKVYDDGAVCALMGASEDVWLETVVAQGCRPIGSPFVATRTEGNKILELAGEPALSRLTKMVKAELTEDDVQRAADGLLVGRVIDEHKAEFGRGDFLIRTFMDANPDEGSLTIGEKIAVGTTVQFHLRDGDVADIELRQALTASDADAALMFTATGRGEGMFEEPDHDAGVVAQLLDDPPTAGFFTSGEFGPLNGNNYVHGFTASLGLFSDQS